MTISITLNSHLPSKTTNTTTPTNHHHHRGGGYYCSSSTYLSSASSSPSRKVRPYRKLQPYHGNHSASFHPGDDYCSHNINQSPNNMYHHYHGLPQPQILSNGYTVIPMLSLHDAAVLNYKQQQAQEARFLTSPHYSELETALHASSHRSVSLLPATSYLFDHQTRLNDMNSLTTRMFPSLTPTVTTVLPSSSSSSSSSARHEEVVSDESSSLSSYSAPSMISSASSSSSHSHDKRTTPRVRFAPTATMHTLPATVSDKDVYQSWYQVEDYHAFERENRDIVTYIHQTLKEYCQTKDLSKLSRNVLQQTLSHILQQKQNDASSTSALLPIQILGLEQFLYGPKYMYERRQETIHHNMMVLEMYDVQRCTTVQHPPPDRHHPQQVLRRVSERFSMHNVERAIQRATTAMMMTTTTVAQPTLSSSSLSSTTTNMYTAAIAA